MPPEAGVTRMGWRPMRAADIDGVVHVAAASFPEHFERRECFEERFALFPQGCFTLASGDAIRGYLIAYPMPVGTIPPLDSLLGALPDQRDEVYLHDLALHPDARGRGLARPIVARLIDTLRCDGVRTIHLVSVNASTPFWQAMGFTPVEADAAIACKLASYSDASTYMIREL